MRWTSGRRRPRWTPGEAVRAVQDDVGSHRSRGAPRGPSGARAATDYGDDTTASLVTFAGRLAWRVRYRAGADAVYDATVDAAHAATCCGGRTWSSPRRRRWSGSASRARRGRHGGDRRPRGARLAGAERGEPQRPERPRLQRPRRQRRGRGERGGRRGPPAGSRSRSAGRRQRAATPAHLCSWSGGTSTTGRSTASRTPSRPSTSPTASTTTWPRRRSASPRPRARSRAPTRCCSTRSTAPRPARTADHVNNANMFTPPDGSPPRCRCTCGARRSGNISSGSDAAILYHEYTHGLSNRLVTDADGYGALNSAAGGRDGGGAGATGTRRTSSSASSRRSTPAPRARS